MIDPTNKTECLPCTWSGDNQDRTQRSFYGAALLEGGIESHAGTVPSTWERAQSDKLELSSSTISDLVRPERLGTLKE
jgi:hypothetical protein